MKTRCNVLNFMKVVIQLVTRFTNIFLFLPAG